MKRLPIMWISLGLGVAGVALAADTPLPLAPRNLNSTVARLMPPLPQAASPVALFRQLLNMSWTEREKYLTNRPPEIRMKLRAKIIEYLSMDPDSRELRLRATELRWQLVPLLRMVPADRGPRLAQVPDDLLPLVNSRLAQWDQLPPALRQEFLANDRTLHYFALVDTSSQPASDPAAEAQREQIASQFNQFFELTPEEKQRTLKTLSLTERAQMEATLRAFGKLTPQQRFECLHAFAKFAELSPGDRAEFLKNAARWSQMTPRERQTWRDLVARIPTWPPVPSRPLPLPPMHLPLPATLHPVMVTNKS